MAGRSLNKVMLIGNLTRDPNLRFTPTGTAVCSFGIATNRSWTPSDGGEKQDRVDFHNIVAWSKLAEICGQFLHKGDKVYVEGRIQTRDWKTEEGVEKRITEIVIDNMMMLSGRGGAGGQGNGGEDMGGADDMGSMSGFSSAPASTTAAKKTKSAPKTDDEVSEVEDVSDDIPF